MRIWPLLLVVACNNDTSFTESSQCDGVLQPGEDSVDDAFDRDGDGYFDGNNPGCLATYPVDALDCDDAAPEVNPGEAEVECDGIDQDCDEDGTPDGDGSTACIDDFSGNWTVSPGPTYQCAYSALFGGYLVNIAFTTVSVVDSGSAISMAAVSSGQPGTMQGVRSDDGTFNVSTTVSGACTETYTLSGQFTDADAFEGTFTAAFSGSMCSDCTLQTWNVTGSKP